MPKRLSMFTPCGAFQLSSKPSRVETYYRAIVEAYGDGFDPKPGSYFEASCYARARALARVRYALDRAGNQHNPLKALDMLPKLEEDYRVVPGPSDTIPQRQRAVAARAVLSRGAREESVVDGLRQILGANFLAYRTIDPTEVSTFPVWPSSDANRRAKPTLGATPKFLVLTDIVAATGAPWTVSYANLDPSSGDVTLDVGDTVVVQAGHTWLQEVVTVTATAGTGASRTFTATFANAHDIGAMVTTMDWPYNWSNQGTAFVVVAHASAVDAESRRKVNEQMARIAKGSTQWAIVESTTPGFIGPFHVGVSPLGCTPSGTLPFTPSP